MNKNLQIFSSPEFGQVRVVMKGKEPWFVGKDVADVLEYQNGSRDINRHVDEDDRMKMKKAIYNAAEAVWTAAYALFLGWLIIRVLEG